MGRSESEADQGELPAIEVQLDDGRWVPARLVNPWSGTNVVCEVPSGTFSEPLRKLRDWYPVERVRVAADDERSG